MAKPCPQCRSTRTRSVDGWQDRLLKTLGWRVRRCSDCGTLRRVPSAVVEAERAARAARHRERRRRERPTPAAASPSFSAEAYVPAAPGVASAVANDPEGGDEWEVTLSCPYCGSTKTFRSKRSFWEHLLRRGRMMRCRGCGRRFPEEKGRPATRLA